MVRRLGFYLMIVLPLALAGCGSDSGNDLSANGANGVDPALATALQDQIMVDPALSQQANGDSIRPPGQPYAGGVPATGVAANTDAIDNGQLMRTPAPTTADRSCTQCAAARESVTLGGLAQRQAGATGGCAANVQYGAAWANRLPADIPLYPQARISEAAGTDAGPCRLRVVTFTTSQPMQLMLDWYYTKLVRAGYTAEHQLDGQEHVLGGTRDRDDAAYVIYLRATPDGGTELDIVANNGV